MVNAISCYIVPRYDGIPLYLFQKDAIEIIICVKVAVMILDSWVWLQHKAEVFMVYEQD